MLAKGCLTSSQIVRAHHDNALAKAGDKPSLLGSPFAPGAFLVNAIWCWKIANFRIQIFAATEANAKLWCTTGFFSVVNEHVRETNQFW